MDNYFNVDSQQLWEGEGDNTSHRYLIVADHKPTSEPIAQKLASRLPEFTDQEMAYLIDRAFAVGACTRSQYNNYTDIIAEKGTLELPQRQAWLQDVENRMGEHNEKEVAGWLLNN